MTKLPNVFLKELTKLLGRNAVLTETEDLLPYLKDERGLLESDCSLVIRPNATEEISETVGLCAKHRVPVVPLGGNTGLVGGGIASGGVILSLEKLNRIIHIDTLNHTMTVEAGCILANIQKAADEAGCLFPLSLGAEGSCQIGGNLSTNAGGVGVLHYGNARDLVLGIEVVLPNGLIYENLKALRKDNTGYDLKQLFIGAEGTLGIITKAVLKLYPRPRAFATILVALEELDEILSLFDLTRATCGDKLKAFELIPRLALELEVAHIPGIRDPFTEKHAYYALLELTSPRQEDDLRGEIETVLEQALNNGVISDAVIAKSQAQASQLWKMREEIPAAQSIEGGSLKHDVAVPVSKSVEFIKKATQLVMAEMPGVRVCAFGHVGDGNIHFNLTQPVGIDQRSFLKKQKVFGRIVHDLVVGMKGSISAEHGIGLSKRDELCFYASKIEIDLMRQIKVAIDPHNQMNPNKIVLFDPP